jgi:hypothetical protein
MPVYSRKTRLQKAIFSQSTPREIDREATLQGGSQRDKAVKLSHTLRITQKTKC